jgi:S1-C subfamily serine protease
MVLGSGILIISDGYVITAKHVLDGCNETIIRCIKNGQQLEFAVIWGDAANLFLEIRVVR